MRVCLSLRCAALQEILFGDARVFGTCIAFEPYMFDEKKESYNLYACRELMSPSEINVKPLPYEYRKEDCEPGTPCNHALDADLLMPVCVLRVV